MEKTIAQPEWNHLAPLAEFRKHVWEATRSAETRLLRDDGKPGRIHHKIRKALLERLLTVQKAVEFDLISVEEIQAIKNIWREEGYHEQ